MLTKIVKSLIFHRKKILQKGYKSILIINNNTNNNNISTIQYKSIANLYTYSSYQKARQNIDPKKDYYKILDVQLSASQNQIKQAYYRLAKIYHPDHNKNLKQTSKFEEIQQAYDILSIMQKRAAYQDILMQQMSQINQYKKRFNKLNIDLKKFMEKKTRTMALKGFLVFGSIFLIVGYIFYKIYKKYTRKNQIQNSLIIKKEQQNIFSSQSSLSKSIDHRSISPIITLPYSLAPYSYINNKNKNLIQIYYDFIYNMDNDDIRKQENIIFLNQSQIIKQEIKDK